MLNTTLYPFWGQTHLFNLVPNVSLPDAVQHEEGGGDGGKEKKTSEQGWGWLVELLLFGKRCIAVKLWSDSVLLHIEPFWGPLDGMVKKRFNEILEIHATKGHQPKQATTFQGIYLILRERERYERFQMEMKKTKMLSSRLSSQWLWCTQLFNPRQPFNSHEWPRQNFSLQNQYNIK